MTDRDAVEALLFEYAARLDAGDLDGVAALFADATYGAAGGPVRRGDAAVRDALREKVRLHDDGTPRTKHVTTNVVVDVAPDGATAAARSYFTVLQATPALPLQVVIAGRYDDRFVRRDGGWRFAARTIHVDLTGDLREHLHAPGAPRRQ